MPGSACVACMCRKQGFAEVLNFPCVGVLRPCEAVFVSWGVEGRAPAYGLRKFSGCLKHPWWLVEFKWGGVLISGAQLRLLLRQEDSVPDTLCQPIALATPCVVLAELRPASGSFSMSSSWSSRCLFASAINSDLSDSIEEDEIHLILDRIPRSASRLPLLFTFKMIAPLPSTQAVR